MISFCLFLFGEPMPRPSQMSAACVCPAELYVSRWLCMVFVADTQQSCVLVMLLWRTALPLVLLFSLFPFSRVLYFLFFFDQHPLK